MIKSSAPLTAIGVVCSLVYVCTLLFFILGTHDITSAAITGTVVSTLGFPFSCVSISLLVMYVPDQQMTGRAPWEFIFLGIALFFLTSLLSIFVASTLHPVNDFIDPYYVRGAFMFIIGLTPLAVLVEVLVDPNGHSGSIDQHMRTFFFGLLVSTVLFVLLTS